MIDSSDELVKIAKQYGRHDAIVGDALDPPHPANRFDFAISIAVLHHLSTRERRVEGVRAALNLLRLPAHPVLRSGISRDQERPKEDNNTGGQALFFVWALEQKGSRRGWDEGGEQDVLVPWVLKPASESSRQGKPEHRAKKSGKRKTKGDSEGQTENKNITLDISGGMNSSTDHIDHDTQEKASSAEQVEQKSSQVYQRYYHLYHQGELEEDIVSAGGEIVRNGYDRDNWWCIAKRRAE